MIFKPNPGFPEEFAAEPETRDGLAKAAEGAVGLVENFAQNAGAPWMPRPGADLIEVVQDGDSVYISNSDYGAHLYEFGSKRSAVHAPLRRGVEAAGLRFVDEGRL